jgi:uncharacterized membrane protein
MSRSRVTIMGITIALTALVANSVLAYIAGKEPVVFHGLPFWFLVAMWAFCCVVAVAVVRSERRDRAERVRAFKNSIKGFDEGSGSFRRPVR